MYSLKLKIVNQLYCYLYLKEKNYFQFIIATNKCNELGSGRKRRKKISSKNVNVMMSAIIAYD